ncbi:MAG: ankyrin repeat domain-containing protein [Deltaproteobacteria bacterium]|nr:ankyrin repeat domain-containing protein [Deltaproteobacteria bacterium]
MSKRVFLFFSSALIFTASFTFILTVNTEAEGFSSTSSISPQQHLRQSMLMAAGMGKTEQIKSLLKQGADVNGVNPKNGYTPLYHAVKFNRFEAVKLLVENGADINVRTSQGVSIEEEAQARGNADIINFLKNHK